MDIVSAKGIELDLGLVRDVLKSGNIDYSKNDVSFLRTHGEWADIPLIVGSLNRVSYSSGLMLFGSSSHYREAAEAIYR